MQLSVSTVHKALRKTMQLKKRPCRWVPHFLNANQKNWRLQAARALLRTSRQPNFFNRIITGDELWCINYDPASRASTMTWLSSGERRPPKTRMQRNALKVMIIIFWDSAGVVFKEFVPRGQGVTAAYYLGVMCRLRDSIRRRHPVCWQRNDWMLQHNNAPTHHGRRVQEFLQRTRT